VGQRVFGLADWTRDGSLAEYTAVEARNLAPLPVTNHHEPAWSTEDPAAVIVLVGKQHPPQGLGQGKRRRSSGGASSIAAADKLACPVDAAELDDCRPG